MLSLSISFPIFFCTTNIFFCPWHLSFFKLFLSICTIFSYSTCLSKPIFHLFLFVSNSIYSFPHPTFFHICFLTPTLPPPLDSIPRLWTSVYNFFSFQSPPPFQLLKPFQALRAAPSGAEDGRPERGDHPETEWEGREGQQHQLQEGMPGVAKIIRRRSYNSRQKQQQQQRPPRWSQTNGQVWFHRENFSRGNKVFDLNPWPEKGLSKIGWIWIFLQGMIVKF